MTNIIIDRTENTPYVLLDFQKNEIIFIGRSISESSVVFYEKILMILEPIIGSKIKFHITIDMEYINTSSSRMFSKFFKLMQNNISRVNWIVEADDEGLIDLGEDFSSIYQKVPFYFIEK